MDHHPDSSDPKALSSYEGECAAVTHPLRRDRDELDEGHFQRWSHLMMCLGVYQCGGHPTPSLSQKSLANRQGQRKVTLLQSHRKEKSLLQRRARSRAG